MDPRHIKANPVLGLPSAVAALGSLDEAQREGLRTVLLAIQAEARPLADKSWTRGKGPMAVYWKAVGVYAGHIARATRRVG